MANITTRERISLIRVWIRGSTADNTELKEKHKPRPEATEAEPEPEAGGTTLHLLTTLLAMLGMALFVFAMGTDGMVSQQY